MIALDAGLGAARRGAAGRIHDDDGSERSERNADGAYLGNLSLLAAERYPGSRVTPLLDGYLASSFPVSGIVALVHQFSGFANQHDEIQGTRTVPDLPLLADARGGRRYN